MVREEIDAIKLRRAGTKDAIEDKLMDSCRHAYRIGRHQARITAIRKAVLFDTVNWMRGAHQPLIWAAYKSGLWENQQERKYGG